MAGWLALAVLLLLALPLFIRMPLNGDTAFYDICARHVLRGGALERDFLFLPPPGMPWALALVRAVGGGSSEAARVADLAIVSAIVWLLVRWMRATGTSRAGRVWAVVLLYAFYLSTSEWVHCQPDVWMLLPALGALHLRRLQVQALTEAPVPARRAAALSFLEGLGWATACLFKPFAAVPALVTWLASVGLARRSGKPWGGWLARDAGFLLAGGLLGAAVWQGWLLASGSWSPYWQNVHDFRGFYAKTRDLGERCLGVFYALRPWGAFHAAALPIAFASLAGLVLPRGKANGRPRPAGNVATVLLSALYLGWLFQANFLQAQFDYHAAPAMLLALALIATEIKSRGTLSPGWASVVLVAGTCLIWQGHFSAARLSSWPQCWREGNSATLRDRLSLDTNQEFAPNWQDLEKVAAFLKARHVGDGELTCYNSSTYHLYLELAITPSTRFIPIEGLISLFPHKREQINEELRASGQRYIVTDMRSVDLSPAQAEAERPGEPLALPPDLSPVIARLYPFSEPVVFRAGRYYVHEARKQP